MLLADSPDIDRLTRVFAAQVRRAAGLDDGAGETATGAELGAMAARHGVTLSDAELEGIRSDVDNAVRRSDPETSA